MKENKEKEVVSEENRTETQAQVCPSTKRKPLSKNLDIGNLPSRRGKKAKHMSSQAAKPNSPPP